ncbi:hypothetical protein KSP39_PZI023761 [Platanthera zijinensis]|uniref:DNA-directed RNA polymerase RBP11-like dimerisation domain-containing protein n=1 Tax=Platanthera zijinensis TaxID=2320716 RepID=A0AAP0ASR0_9ASPA
MDVSHKFCAHAFDFDMLLPNLDPRVEFCGYSIPHPSENKVNIRVQTTGDAAKDVLKDSLQDLILMCQHVRFTFDHSVSDFILSPSYQEMNTDT